MELIIIPSMKEEIKVLLNKDIDGIILGLSELSINLPFYLNEEELYNNILDIKKSNKKVYVYLNKNIHNGDLLLLRDVLLKLNDIKVDGVFFYDLAIMNIKNELELAIPFIWAQEHVSTNYNVINYYYSKNIKGTLISNEITIANIKDIRENTKSVLFTQIFGHIPMFSSPRTLISNYLTYTKSNRDSSHTYLYNKQRNEEYPVIEDEKGTHIYSSHILNGIREYSNLKEISFDNVIINGFNFNSEPFIKIIDIFIELKKGNLTDREAENLINEMKLHTDYGFFYKETVYKVKKNRGES